MVNACEIVNVIVVEVDLAQGHSMPGTSHSVAGGALTGSQLPGSSRDNQGPVLRQVTLEEAWRKILALEQTLRSYQVLVESTLPASKEVKTANAEIRRANETLGSTVTMIMDRRHHDLQVAERRAVYKFLLIIMLGGVLGIVVTRIFNHPEAPSNVLNYYGPWGTWIRRGYGLLSYSLPKINYDLTSFSVYKACF
ncbi:hypothetical protein OF83DRAFT_1085704 [Amylostereum chailletii]|nr:hypothetical protein OF83DRAFT_1085704 [Amylostereum chailletii]